MAEPFAPVLLIYHNSAYEIIRLAHVACQVDPSPKNRLKTKIGLALGYSSFSWDTYVSVGWRGDWELSLFVRYFLVRARV